MKNGKTVLISGASIAGPALAFWLQKAGFDVTIVEKSEGLRKGGYGVDIRGAAVEVIERMGILDEVRKADTKMDGLYMVNTKGALIQMNDAATGNQHGVDIEIMRDDLTAILYEQTKSKVTYIWGDSIASMAEGEDVIEVEFEHAPTRRFDLVIGADGVHSATRSLAFGEESQFSTFLDCYIAIFTTKNFLELDHRHVAYSMLGKMASMYSARDNSEAKAVFFFKSTKLTYGYHDTQEQKQLLANAFKGESGWTLPRLMKALDTSSDFYFDSISQIHLPEWSKGRVALVGDAAYGASPASGQGSSLALVGAYVLAGELKVCEGDYQRAFANYHEKMKDYVAACQQLAETTIQDMIIDSPLKFKAFNFLLRFPKILHASMDGSTKKFNETVAKVANSIILEDY